MRGRYSRRKVPGNPKPKKARFDLKISKALDALFELPEENLTLREKDILRRIQERLSDSVVGGRYLTRADYMNIKKIAQKNSVKIPK